MRFNILRIPALMALAVITCNESPVAAQTNGWHATFDEARAAAENNSLPLLIHFHAWYCSPCKQMDRDVFCHADVQQALATGIAAVNVDVTKEPELGSRFGVTGVPCDVVIYPDGRTETLGSGKVARSAYLSMLDRIVSHSRDIVSQKSAESSIASTTEQNTTSGGGVPAAAVAETTPAAELIGLEGFCPVKLHSRREWVEGSSELTAEFRGIVYRFSGATERDEFLKNPAEFAPQDLGCDPVILTDSQRTVAGSIRYGAFFDDRLYLFETAGNRDLFKQSPLKFSRIRSALKAEDIEVTSLN